MRYLPGQPITRSKLLLGEGVEEWLLLSSLLEHLGRDDVQVDQYAGKNKLAESMRALVRRAGFSGVEVVGVTRDADFLDEPAVGKTTAAAAAFDSVRHALRGANLPEPVRLAEFIESPFEGRSIRVGAFVFPDCDADGMLEDLCLSAIAPDPAIHCIDDLFECVDRTAQRQCGRTDRAKARLNAWLATQVIPDKRLGTAAADGFFDWESPAFAGLKQFLTSL